MESISATIITRNEEENLERCLNALRDVADEIVVVDSYSNDRTPEICRRYGCKLTSREFQGFGSQRQYAAGLTTHNYVLSIDADEVLSEDLRSEIIRLKHRGFAHRVYSVRVINYFCGKPVLHSGWHPHTSARLFNKRYANWNLHDVHDCLNFPESLTPCLLPGEIHHYRCSSMQDFHRKENRLAAMKARIIATSAHNRHVLPLVPHLRAGLDFLHCNVAQKALLDGSRGMAIAMRRYRTTLAAYRMARVIINDSKAPLVNAHSSLD